MKKPKAFNVCIITVPEGIAYEIPKKLGTNYVTAKNGVGGGGRKKYGTGKEVRGDEVLFWLSAGYGNSDGNGDYMTRDKKAVSATYGSENFSAVNATIACETNRWEIY